METTKHKLGAWHRVLLGLASDIVYRLCGTPVTSQFYSDLADQLEGLAKRVRREIERT